MARSFGEIWKVVDRQMAEVKKTLPKELGKQAQRFFTATFNDQGFTDWSKNRWAEVNRRIAGTSEYKYPKKGASRRHSRAILVGTGKLRGDVARSMKSATWDRITFEVESDYGAYHNEGTERLQQRQFMGHSHTLNNELLETINKRLARVFAVK